MLERKRNVTKDIYEELRHLWEIYRVKNLKLREIIYEEYGQKYDKEKTSKRC